MLGRIGRFVDRPPAFVYDAPSEVPMKLHRFAAVLAVLSGSCGSVACDGSDPDADGVEQNADGGGTADDDANPNPRCPSAENLAEGFAEAVCQKRGECCDDDYEVCITEVTDALDAIYVDLADAIEAGTAELDCESYRACTAAVLSAECSDWPLQTGDLAEIPVDEPRCRQMVTPAVAAGEECSWNYECQAGACRAEDGLCYAFARENESCEDMLCDLPTHFCNGAGLCQKRLGDGVSCTDAEECQSRVCDLEGSGTCVAPGPDACQYVPSAPATCSLRPHGQSGGRVTLLAALAGLLLLLGRGAGRRPTVTVGARRARSRPPTAGERCPPDRC